MNTLLNSDESMTPGMKKRLANLKPFQSGQPSPNPQGRPKKENTYSDIARELLSAKSLEITIVNNGKKRTFKTTANNTFRHALIIVQINEALKGNINAIRDLIDRADGKPALQGENTGQQPVNLIIQENIVNSESIHSAP